MPRQGSDPHFPIYVPEHGRMDTGLTIRENFALTILSGILSSPWLQKQQANWQKLQDPDMMKALAVMAVQQADTLVAVLNSTPAPQ